MFLTEEQFQVLTGGGQGLVDLRTRTGRAYRAIIDELLLAEHARDQKSTGPLHCHHIDGIPDGITPTSYRCSPNRCYHVRRRPLDPSKHTLISADRGHDDRLPWRLR
jgi:hypothetical protein